MGLWRDYTLWPRRTTVSPKPYYNTCCIRCHNPQSCKLSVDCFTSIRHIICSKTTVGSDFVGFRTGIRHRTLVRTNLGCRAQFALQHEKFFFSTVDSCGRLQQNEAWTVYPACVVYIMLILYDHEVYDYHHGQKYSSRSTSFIWIRKRPEPWCARKPLIPKQRNLSISCKRNTSAYLVTALQYAFQLPN